MTALEGIRHEQQMFMPEATQSRKASQMALKERGNKIVIGKVIVGKGRTS